jgi:lipocalin-like protein
MKIRILLALAGLSAGFITPAITQTTAKDLVGTWTLVSVTLEEDGKTRDMYGANPQGLLVFHDNGRVSVIITRSDLPKFASNNREAETPEENKAIVQGSLAFFRHVLGKRDRS